MSRLEDHVASWRSSPFASHAREEAWHLVGKLEAVVSDLIDGLGDAFAVDGRIAIHHTARVEDGASLKGPLVIGPGCFIAADSLLRGGCWIDAGCSVGPGSELKSSLLFRRSRLAHFNFVGDSILGEDVNLEAGAVVANYRNELGDPRLRIAYRGGLIESDIVKFGALVGDGSRLGANAVVAPGAILAPGTVVPRLGLIDQRPGPTPSTQP